MEGTAAGEKSILLHSTAYHRGKGRNVFFLIYHIAEHGLGIIEIFDDIPSPSNLRCEESSLVGVNCAFVGSFLYTIGGRVPNYPLVSDCICHLDTRNRSNGRKIGTLPSPCAYSVIGVYGDYLYVLPGKWKPMFHLVDEYTYLTSQPCYIWNTKDNTCHIMDNLPPTVEGGKRQWRRIRACAALDGRGLLIAMDGEKNFFLHNPEMKDWEVCEFEDSLPKFMGETSFSASNGRLFILEVPATPPVCLCVYDINEGKLVMDKQPIPGFEDLWSMDEWNREVRLVPVADDKLCFLWLGPTYYNCGTGNFYAPVRIVHCLKVKFSVNPSPAIQVVDSKDFRTNIIHLLDCLPCDPSQDQVEGIAPLYLPLSQGKFAPKAVIAPPEAKSTNISPVDLNLLCAQCLDRVLTQNKLPSKK